MMIVLTPGPRSGNGTKNGIGQSGRDAAAGKHGGEPQQRAHDETGQRTGRDDHVAVGATRGRHSAAGLGETQHHGRHPQRTQEIGDERVRPGGASHAGGKREDAGTDDGIGGGCGQSKGADAAYQAVIPRSRTRCAGPRRGRVVHEAHTPCPGRIRHEQCADRS